MTINFTENCLNELIEIGYQEHFERLKIFNEKPYGLGWSFS
jgi:hypothetical protein